MAVVNTYERLCQILDTPTLQQINWPAQCNCKRLRGNILQAQKVPLNFSPLAVRGQINSIATQVYSLGY